VKIIDEFFIELDKRWKPEGDHKIPLKIIGSAALLLQVDYDRGTKDSDVLETADITPPIKEKLLALAGKGTDLSKTFRLYLDVVAAGIPFLPLGARFHKIAGFNRRLKHFEVEALDVTDVAVSKMKRFNANDVSDISAMVSGRWEKHAHLVERFRKAVDAYSTDARAEDLPKYVTNLHTVERDFFREPESEIELPHWV
jgi:hypothetical protein